MLFRGDSPWQRRALRPGQHLPTFPPSGAKASNSSCAAADIAALSAGLRGQLLLRGDVGYDVSRRVWNGSFDRYPALVARCVGASDIVQAVNFAREHDLLLAVRGGGHSISGSRCATVVCR